MGGEGVRYEATTHQERRGEVYPEMVALEQVLIHEAA